jgi:hypothetical protein
MSAGRLVVAVLLLLASAVLVWHLTRPAARGDGGGGPAPEVPTRGRPMTLASSEQCAACHPEVYAEWKASHHRLAYENPEVQRLSRGFQDKDCLPCHLPRPILETGLSERPLERGDRFEEGVDCFTCHFHPASQVMIGRGPLGPAAEAAPCLPVVSPLISDMGLCAPCHNQHKVHDDWAQSAFAVPGAGFKDCNDCHFPRLTRKDGRPGRSHRTPGAHDPEMLRSAARIRVDRAGPRGIVIGILNDGAGHNFPADERHRAVDVELRVRSARGESASARVFRFRNPYRQEFEIRNPLRAPGASFEDRLDLGALGTATLRVTRVAAGHRPERTNPYPESTQIPAGEARVLELLLPETVVQATVEVDYRIQPYQPDPEATLLHAATLDLR